MLDWIYNNLLLIIVVGVIIFYLPNITKTIKKWKKGFKE